MGAWANAVEATIAERAHVRAAAIAEQRSDTSPTADDLPRLLELAHGGVAGAGLRMGAERFILEVVVQRQRVLQDIHDVFAYLQSLRGE